VGKKPISRRQGKKRTGISTNNLDHGPAHLPQEGKGRMSSLRGTRWGWGGPRKPGGVLLDFAPAGNRESMK